MDDGFPTKYIYSLVYECALCIRSQNKQLKTAVQNIDSVSNHSDTLNSPQTPQKLPGGNWAFHTMPAANSRPSEEPTTPRGVVKVESREIFMPAPNIDGEYTERPLCSVAGCS